MSAAAPTIWEAKRGLRRGRALAVVPYALLGALVVTTVVVKPAGASRYVDLGLCALAAAWMLVLFTLRPSWRDRAGVMAVFFTGLVAITAVLIVRDPWFGCFSPACYMYAFRVLRWPWTLPGVAVVAILAGTAQGSDLDLSDPADALAFAAVLVVNVVPMCALVLVFWHRARYEVRRERELSEVSADKRRLEATLAENAALHGRLVAQAREAGVLDERQRMAREIHDTLAQGLTGIVTQLQAAEDAASAGDGDPDRWRRHVTAATALARESLTEARRSVHALRPAPLESAGLGDALADIAGHWSARHGIDVQVAATGTARPLSPEAEAALLRTAQEALANVAKHAGAGRVGVTLSYLDDDVALDIRDDGGGFTPAAVPAPPDDHAATEGGFGLLGMRERIERLAGTLHVESEPGAGTAVCARVPAAGARG